MHLAGTLRKYNKVKNNIFANTQSLGRPDDASYLYNWCTYSQPGHVATDNTITRNAFPGTTDKWRYDGMVRGTFAQWEAHTSDVYNSIWQSDPMFTNANSRNFTLRSNSPMIDAGAFLTTVTSTTASGRTTFTVDDAAYFYDGWGIPGETGDKIKTEHGQVTTIQTIDYDTHTITVSPALT